MSLARSVVVGAWVAVLLPAAAFAQGSTLESGRLRTVKPAGGWGMGKADARNIGRKFGQCVVARSPGRAERFVALPVGTPAQIDLMKSVLSEECLGGGEYALSAEIARGLVFEALYLRDFAGRPLGDLGALPPSDYRSAYPGGVPGIAVNTVALAEFGDCVARADSGNAQALILSLPDTVAENAAIAALSPRLPACVPQSQNIRFSRSVLRGAIAEGLYRLSRAASGRPFGAAAVSTTSATVH